MSRNSARGSVPGMLTLDAQCLLVRLADQEDTDLPDIFLHGRDGSLTFGFAPTRSTYTWEEVAVREMAERWRSLAADVPPRIADHVAAHRRFVTLLDTDAMDPPDAVVHDLATGEVRACWEEEKVVVVVEQIAGAAGRR